MSGYGYYNGPAPLKPAYSFGGAHHSSASYTNTLRQREEEEVSYFVPGFEISRHVILTHYQEYVGPAATIRPFTYQKREGYLITHAGKPLTQDQIGDLKRRSYEYEQKEAARMALRSGLMSRGDIYVPSKVNSRKLLLAGDYGGYIVGSSLLLGSKTYGKVVRT